MLCLTPGSATSIVKHPLEAMLKDNSSWQQLKTADHISRLKT